MCLSGAGGNGEECEEIKEEIETNNAERVGEVDPIYAGDITRVSKWDPCL